ncbi:hypothetical protein P4S73_17690 [Paraglaciecola sp. Hal342]
MRSKEWAEDASLASAGLVSSCGGALMPPMQGSMMIDGPALISGIPSVQTSWSCYRSFALQ